MRTCSEVLQHDTWFPFAAPENCVHTVHYSVPLNSMFKTDSPASYRAAAKLLADTEHLMHMAAFERQVAHLHPRFVGPRRVACMHSTNQMADWSV